MTTTQAYERRSTHRTRASILTLLAAVAAGELIWLIAALGHIDMTIPQAGQTVGPASVAAVALVGGGLAWALRAVLQRAGRGLRAWTITGTIVLVLSLAAPVLSGATGATLFVCEAMHVAVGLTLLIGLHRAGRLGPARLMNA
ncbi:hypothetical protein SAMN04489806_1739 [Paramicrobacterium humi]|uniref:Uncharacterized protein n=1 Tax=Paramicrobacterium humi TaxID=640635 RepID=A0A1H4M3K6_9MICO|nr:DUF6069 family protein [Microbacterium humi]SEB77348.1 hypothetical protein SAMN04489806_1739 [Microbacterium humi]